MADKQITPFQLTDQFTMDNFNQRINETNIALQSKPNPNLLDNWYFANPVNQRGQTSYTDTGYTIDRWKSDFGNAVLIESDEYLTVGSHQFHQLIENYKSFVGKTVTCSALSIDASVDMYIQTGIGQEITQQRLLDSVGKYVSITTFVMPENATKLDFLIGGATTKKIVACKLELGSQQTLAHQENGVWVLNEIPDYGEQLARCQRYFERVYLHNGTILYAVKENRLSFEVSYKVRKRATPTIVTYPMYVVRSSDDTGVYGALVAKNPTSIIAGIDTAGINFNDTQVNAIPVGQYGYLSNIKTLHLDVSADL